VNKLKRDARVLETERNTFQDTIINSVSQHLHPYVIHLKGIEYTIFPGVFNPNYAKPSLFFLENLGVMEGDIVLDLFTGCGIDAIEAVRQGASKVVAIDKFTMPYLCTKYNVEKLELNNRVEVRQGDLFEALREGEKFDLILANPPFRRMKATSPIESAIRDDNYITLRRLFSNIREYMKDGARLRLVFADIGDIDFMLEVARGHFPKPSIIAETRYASVTRIQVFEFVRD
jgi:release factor glutamine methyltransferase